MAQMKEFCAKLKVGARQTHRNMTLNCLLSEHEAPVRFLTLDNALANDALAISELTEGGSVPEFKVANKSDQNVLLMDGEELVGAKQNRVLNTTTLIGPKSETVNLNLRIGRNFMSDQGIVWDEIERKYQRMSASPSPTMAIADLYESQKDVTTEYLAAFRPVANQTGMIVFIDGHVMGFEILYRFGAFRRKHSKLVNSYVMDALESVGVSEIEIKKSVALGNGVSLESRNQILQMTVFASKNGKEASPTSKMRIASARRESQGR